MTELEKLIQRREQILTEIDAVLQDGDGSPRVELTDDQQLEHDTLVEEFDSVSAKITDHRTATAAKGAAPSTAVVELTTPPTC